MENSKKKRSTPFHMGELKAQKFISELLLRRLTRLSIDPQITAEKTPLAVTKVDTSAYRRLAEVEGELARAQRFIDSLHQSRAYRLTMRVLRMIGRAK